MMESCCVEISTSEIKQTYSNVTTVIDTIGREAFKKTHFLDFL